MSYNVTVYKDTGFVGGNIPDSPALLGAGVSKSALEILQDGELSSIKISIDWAEAKLVDYIKVGSVYYIVQGRQMLATDVCEFEILEDGITTIGGVSQIQILDGITERCHLPNSADGDKDDPLLAPQEPLVLDTQLFGQTSNFSQFVTVAECTISPLSTKEAGESISYQGDGDVTIPKPIAYSEDDVVKYVLPTYKRQNGADVETDISTDRGTGLEVISTKNSPIGYTYIGGVKTPREIKTRTGISDAMSEMRGLGLDTAIINQVEYPASAVDIILHSTNSEDPYDERAMVVREVRGRSGHQGQATDLPFVYSNNVNNDILFVSDFTKYGLLSASGAKAEFTVKSIKDPTKTFSQQAHPTVDYMTDPNPDGKPYYRYEFFNGNKSKVNFLANAIPGLPWKQVPIIFTGKSGGTLDRINFETERYANERNFQAGRVADNINTGISIASDAVNGFVSSQGNPLWAAQAATSTIGGLASLSVKNVYENEKYRNDLYKSRVNYELSQVAAPTLNFPYSSEPLRVQMGNGVYAYRYKYSNNDLARIDKLITMYGVKTTKALEASMFTSRRYFNFVKCDDVTVIGNTRHLNEVVSAQLRGGVRIWHVKPDPAKYLTENI